MPSASRAGYSVGSLPDMNLHPLLPAGEFDAFQKALTNFSDRCVRLHAKRPEPTLPFEVSAVPWYGWGRILADSSLRPASFLNYATADYYIQDAASLLPLALLDPQASDKICDLCASPGGKASAIAERLGPEGFLLANESIRSRVDVLRYSLAKTGNPCFAVSTYDPDDLASQLPQSFDAVLVDAPCSGQTLVARNKRDENAFAENQIEHCALRQQRILQSAIRMLKLGGRLIYSTCTFAVEENESQIRWLLEQYPSAWEPIEICGLEPWRSPLEAGCYRLWPHRDHCAGGFAAGLRLVREIDFEHLAVGHRLSKRREEGTEKQIHRTAKEKQKTVQEVLSTLGVFHDMTTHWKSGYAQCVTSGATDALNEWSHIAMDPMAVLIETGSHFVPTQGLALLDSRYFKPTKTIELDGDQSKQFARGSSIAIPPIEASSIPRDNHGWTVATWNKKPLGWCKALSNRLNNHLPPWARLNVD